MTFLKNERGYSLTELFIIGLIVAVVGGIAGGFLQLLMRGKESIYQKTIAESQLSLAYDLILRVGRHAGGTGLGACTTPDTSTFQCDVNSQAFGGLVRMRLRRDSATSELVFETTPLPLAATPVYRVQQRYTNISEFLICNYAALQAVSLGNPTLCGSLLPVNIGNIYVATHPADNRFFRFRIKGQVPPDPRRQLPMAETAYQGAVYVRNPNSVGTLSW